MSTALEENPHPPPLTDVSDTADLAGPDTTPDGVAPGVGLDDGRVGGPPTGAAGLGDVLAARDARAARQRTLAAEFGADGAADGGPPVASVVSLTLVAPGPDKNPHWAPTVFAAAMEAAAAAFDPEALRHREAHESLAGPQGYLVLALPPPEVKRRLVTVEDAHPWGRLFDLDVVVDGRPLARTDVGSPPRRCLVCDGPAAPCARARAHDLPTLASAIAAVLE